MPDDTRYALERDVNNLGAKVGTLQIAEADCRARRELAETELRGDMTEMKATIGKMADAMEHIDRSQTALRNQIIGVMAAVGVVMTCVQIFIAILK